MKTQLATIALLSVAFSSHTVACEDCKVLKGDHAVITSTSSRYLEEIDSLILEIKVKGVAGSVTPKPVGELDGAPVFGYVFPTTLKSTDVGFGETEGIVALALVSHPDFDDTSLWDENSDGKYDNDGKAWHPHWVILQKDERVEGGLSVKQFEKGDKSVVLPPTAPGMPMYMDSPGLQVVTSGNAIRVVVPTVSVRGNTDFAFDAVTCFMKVNTSDKSLPMLGVYTVFAVASGDLSLPYKTKNK